ncbi:hypothetical protein C8R44DRAFT_785288 [Mycena epipterygia]|nr:hypothetical protein C8R44DRAFT_785288 [Mycena epipterygia]
MFIRHATRRTNMHQSLRLSRLNDLPDAIRKTAEAAVDGSPNDLQKTVLHLNQLPDAQAILLLPVFHHTLATLATPTAAELDRADVAALGSCVRKTLTMIFAAIRGCIKVGVGRSVPIPPAACRDLWPRMAEWLQFFLTFHDNIRWLGGPSEQLICIDVALFAGSFSHDEPTATLFAATPSFRFMIGRAWLYLLENDGFHVHAYG